VAKATCDYDHLPDLLNPEECAQAAVAALQSAPQPKELPVLSNCTTLKVGGTGLQIKTQELVEFGKESKELPEAEAVIDKLRPWIWHDSGCPALSGEKCKCGLDKVLKQHLKTEGKVL
jgi:hypothetical protein